MKIKPILLMLWISVAALSVYAQSEKFSALGYLPSGAGMRMVGAGSTMNLDLYIDRYSTNQEANLLAGALIEGGNDALLKSLEKVKRIGKIQLTGRVGFYDLKLIRSRPISGGGRQIIAVTDRPISGFEMYAGSRSQDYNFGVIQIVLKPNRKGKERGTGTMIYAAKIKLIKGKTIQIENYGVSPLQLRNVRKW